MDSTQSVPEFIKTLNYFLPALAFLVSFSAFFYSRRAIKYTEKVSKPKVIKLYDKNNEIQIGIQDYSVGKNLRIDCVLFKKYHKHKYKMIKYNHIGKINNSSVVDILISKKLLSTGKIKIETNHGNLFRYYSDTYEIETIKWYELLKKIRLYFHKKGFDKQLL